MDIPLGAYTTLKRRGGLAAVLARGGKAGTIESRSGKARVTPAPRRNVRRGNAFFEITMKPSWPHKEGALAAAGSTGAGILMRKGALLTMPTRIEDQR